MPKWWAFPALLLLSFLKAQSQANPPLPVDGTVVNTLTGQPIAGASVFIRPSFALFGFKERPAGGAVPPRGSDRTATDEFGRFSFEIDPSASLLELWVSSPGYRSRDNKDTVSLSLRPGDAHGITVRLVPQGTIHGQVLSGSGQPVPALRVEAIRLAIRDGRRQLLNDQPARISSDSGEYRVENLWPGSYLIRVAGHGYGPIYYPAAEDPQAAAIVHIAPGQTLTADFQVDSHTAYTVRGRVNNMPIRRRVAVRLIRGEDALSNPVLTYADSGGFEIADVTPGRYVVQAFTPDTVPPSMGEATVTVTESDVSGVAVSLSTGVDVFGRVEFRGPQQHYAMVRAERVSVPPLPMNLRAPETMIGSDGRFTLRNLPPGKYEIYVQTYPDGYVSSISSGSTDVQAEGLTLIRGNPPEVRITMQPGGSLVDGFVEGASPNTSFYVALIQKYGGSMIPRIVRTVKGRFHAAGLPPGDYTLFAWPESRELEYRSPWVLSGLSAYASSVKLAEGATGVVLLKPLPDQFPPPVPTPLQ